MRFLYVASLAFFCSVLSIYADVHLNRDCLQTIQAIREHENYYKIRQEDREVLQEIFDNVESLPATRVPDPTIVGLLNAVLKQLTRIENDIIDLPLLIQFYIQESQASLSFTIVDQTETILSAIDNISIVFTGSISVDNAPVFAAIANSQASLGFTIADRVSNSQASLGFTIVDYASSMLDAINNISTNIDLSAVKFTIVDSVSNSQASLGFTIVDRVDNSQASLGFTIVDQSEAVQTAVANTQASLGFTIADRVSNSQASLGFTIVDYASSMLDAINNISTSLTTSVDLSAVKFTIVDSVSNSQASLGFTIVDRIDNAQASLGFTIVDQSEVVQATIANSQASLGFTIADRVSNSQASLGFTIVDYASSMLDAINNISTSLTTSVDLSAVKFTIVDSVSNSQASLGFTIVDRVDNAQASLGFTIADRVSNAQASLGFTIVDQVENMNTNLSTKLDTISAQIGALDGSLVELIIFEMMQAVQTFTTLASITDHVLMTLTAIDDLSQQIMEDFESIVEAIDASVQSIGFTIMDQVRDSQASLGFTIVDRVDNAQASLGFTIADRVSNSQASLGFTIVDYASSILDAINNVSTSLTTSVDLSAVKFTIVDSVSNSQASLGFTIVDRVDNATQSLGFTIVDRVDNAVQSLGFTIADRVSNAQASLGFTIVDQTEAILVFIANSQASLGFTIVDRVDNAQASLGFTIVDRVDNAVESLGFTIADRVSNAQASLGFTIVDQTEAVFSKIDVAMLCDPTPIRQSDVTAAGGLLRLTTDLASVIRNYCFAQNITGTISIVSDDVSLDLNERSLTGVISIAANRATIMNGTVLPPAPISAGDATFAGIRVNSGSDQALIEDCRVLCTNTAGAFDGRSAIAIAGTNAIVRNCTAIAGNAGTSGNGGHGMLVSSPANKTYVENCLIEGAGSGSGSNANGGDGIRLSSGSTNSAVRNNTITNTGDATGTGEAGMAIRDLSGSAAANTATSKVYSNFAFDIANTSTVYRIENEGAIATDNGVNIVIGLPGQFSNVYAPDTLP